MEQLTIPWHIYGIHYARMHGNAIYGQLEKQGTENIMGNGNRKWQQEMGWGIIPKICRRRAGTIWGSEILFISITRDDSGLTPILFRN